MTNTASVDPGAHRGTDVADESVEDVPRYPVGQIIRDERRARGLTQEAAAEQADISVGAWRSTESGTRRPRPYTFAAVLDLLDLTPAVIHARAEQLRRATPEPETARATLVERCQEGLPSEAIIPVLDVVELIILEAERAAGGVDAHT